MDPYRRILIVTSDALAAAPMGDALAPLENFQVRVIPTGEAEQALQEGCDVAVVGLAEESDNRRVVEIVNGIPADTRPALLVVLPDDLDATLARARDLRADDFICAPYRPFELRARVGKLLESISTRRALARNQRDAEATLELTQVLASSLEFHEILFTLVSRLAEMMRVDRVSIVLVPEHSPNEGHVIAASDDHSLSDLKIDLANYPEIRQTLRTQEPLAINDVSSHPVLDGVRSVVPAQLSALFLVPILWRGRAMGVLFLRTGAERRLSEQDLGFCKVIANATAVALRNAHTVRELKRDHEDANTEAEARAEALLAYEELFASAPDGIAVFDRDGRLQFANPKTYQILGYTVDELAGSRLSEVIAAESKRAANQVWQELDDRPLINDVDLVAKHKLGRELTLSTSFSLLPNEEHRVLTQFRDVTVERAMASELRKTKEFLESLIDASVDAIVAADLTGTIILFNSGAERIYGYDPADVLGSMHVSKLYPEGVALEVMRKIRCSEFGGEGRLQSMHSCAVTADGQMIPISLSAAMIYENDKPVATVGIFADLREKILAEERLAQAQQKLEVSEKQALLAELAGTAAHELNQPLTSVMGYGELLARKLSAGTAEQNAAEVIVRETERMANLVRKIGRITKYETKSYVGDQRILDLEKASDEEG